VVEVVDVSPGELSSNPVWESSPCAAAQAEGPGSSETPLFPLAHRGTEGPPLRRVSPSGWQGRAATTNALSSNSRSSAATATLSGPQEPSGESTSSDAGERWQRVCSEVSPQMSLSVKPRWKRSSGRRTI
jgi:hypothetical protein